MSITVPYTQPLDEAVQRPLVDITLDGLGYHHPGLVDSGSIRTIFPRWIADDAGIDLTDVPDQPLAVGGAAMGARFATVALTVFSWTWEADVGFAEEWQASYALLGHNSFLRYFTVELRAADLTFELEFIAQ